MKKIIKILSFKLWKLFEKLGFYIVPDHFYYPIPNLNKIDNKLFYKKFPLVGLNMDDKIFLNWFKKIYKYNQEYSKIYKNSDFEVNGDGAILYGVIRNLKPNKIIEIGSGYSTYVSLKALEKNNNGKIYAIEPYPSKFLNSLSDEKLVLIDKKVELVDKSIFSNLKYGDILFIDSSHIVKFGNDVSFIYLELLPAIPKGVYIHIHDIPFPLNYPKEWLDKHKFFWNEQYLLHMFLCYNNEFEVVFPANYMYLKFKDEILKLTGSSYNGWPGSFWIRRKS